MLLFSLLSAWVRRRALLLLLLLLMLLPPHLYLHLIFLRSACYLASPHSLLLHLALPLTLPLPLPFSFSFSFCFPLSRPNLRLTQLDLILLVSLLRLVLLLV